MKSVFLCKNLFSCTLLNLFCIVLTLAIFMSGCVSVPSIDSFMSSSDTSSATLANARKAWQAKDMQKVESFYSSLLDSGTLDKMAQVEAWQRIVVAADKNARPDVVFNALDNWVKLDPKADSTKIWENAWVRNVRFLASADVIKRAENIYSSTSSDGIYVRAVIVLMGRDWTAQYSAKFINLLSDYYKTQDQVERIALERMLSNELRYSPFTNLEQLSLLSSKDLVFPQTVILLEKTRREVNQGKNKDAELKMITLSLADKTLVAAVMQGSPLIEQAIAETLEPSNSLPIQGTANEVCIVLALPGQAPLSSIADKIKVGADAAQQELIAKGSNVVIKYVDTNAEDWLIQLNGLPEYCAIVGGPLQITKYKEMKETSIVSHKNAFVFVPRLDANDEGSTAWRFFSSPTDQINALLSLTRDNLGINSYGIFYPEDAYSLHMSSLFEQGISMQGGNVKKASYITGDVSTWIEQAKVLLDAYTVDEASISSANFQAIFLPDSWKNMEMVSTSLLFHGEDRQVLLGTSLWEQGLSLGAGYTSAKYSLAVFPGVWNPSVIPPPLQNVYGLVFWNVLGYDFVHFAHALNLKQYNNPQELQSKLRNAETINWTMAPLRWDAQGKASQKMILFNPTETGFSPINIAEFRSLWENSLKRYDRRVKSILDSAKKGN